MKFFTFVLLVAVLPICSSNVINLNFNDVLAGTPGSCSGKSCAEQAARPRIPEVEHPKVSHSIHGVVVDATTKKPLPTSPFSTQTLTEVVCQSRFTTLGPVYVDSTGEFSFEDVPTAYYTCKATADGYYPNTQSFTPNLRGPSQDIVIPLEVKTTTLSGRVLYRNTTGINSALVSCTGGYLSDRAVTRRSNVDGKFFFTDIPPGEYICIAQAANFASKSQFVTVSSGASNTLNLNLEPMKGSVAGYVLDGRTKEKVSLAKVKCSVNGIPLGSQETDHGTFYYTNVPEGSVSCEASSFGFSSGSTSFTLRKGENATITIALTSLPSVLTGLVVDSLSHEGIDFATVTCVMGVTDSSAMNNYYNKKVETQTNKDGYFTVGTFADVPETFTCVAQKYRYADGLQTFYLPRNTTAEIVISLSTLGEGVRGYVQDGDTGLPVLGATVSCVLPDSTTGETKTTDKRGEFGLFSTGQGKILCSAKKNGFTDANIAVEVRRGHQLVVTILTYPWSGSITGKVEVQKQALAGALVSCSRFDKTYQAYSNNQGVFFFSPVKTGSYNCKITASGHQEKKIDNVVVSRDTRNDLGVLALLKSTAPPTTTKTPTTAAPTTVSPTTAAPTTAAPTTSAPTTSSPTTAAPTTVAPTTAPTTTAPTTSTPTSSPTTPAPTTGAPTTAAPTTGAPTTEAPTTAAPTTGAPTTSAPTTEAPTTAAPTTAGPTTSAPTTEAPTTAAPTTVGPTTGAPTTAAPTTAAPTTAGPTTTAPTTAAPTTSAPTTAPTTGAPTTGAPTTEAPTTVGPTTAPTTSAPTTAAPTTAAPTTSAPTTAAPTTSAPTPTTAAPTTVGPTTGAPTTAAPTTASPTTAAPSTDAPTTAAPTTGAPTTEAPTTAAPTTAAPTTAAPTTAAPTTAGPTTAPTTSAPTTAAPTTGVPTTAAPTTSAPTTEPTTGAPTTAAPTTTAPTTTPTTASPTTTAPTTDAPTTVAPTTEAPTTVAPTTAAPTTAAPTTAAPTTAAPTTVAPTTPGNVLKVTWTGGGPFIYNLQSGQALQFVNSGFHNLLQVTQEAHTSCDASAAGRVIAAFYSGAANGNVTIPAEYFAPGSTYYFICTVGGSNSQTFVQSFGNVSVPTVGGHCLSLGLRATVTVVAPTTAAPTTAAPTTDAPTTAAPTTAAPTTAVPTTPGPGGLLYNISGTITKTGSPYVGPVFINSAVFFTQTGGLFTLNLNPPLAPGNYTFRIGTTSVTVSVTLENHSSLVIAFP